MGKWTESKRKYATSNKSVIDMDAFPPPQPEPAVWIDSGIVKLIIENCKYLKAQQHSSIQLFYMQPRLWSSWLAGL
jgi:hypothetical protein